MGFKRSRILEVGTWLFYVGPTGVFMSTDQGDNWSSAGLSTTDFRYITTIKDSLFVGTNGAGIYKVLIGELTGFLLIMA